MIANGRVRYPHDRGFGGNTLTTSSGSGSAGDIVGGIGDAVSGVYDEITGSSGGPAENHESNPWKTVNRDNYKMPGWFYNNTQKNLGRADQVWGRQESGDWRDQQMALAQMLQRRANGEDSLAARQLREAADANVAQQQALAASANPQNAAMMARVASQNAGRINSGLAGQTQQARIQEQAAAQQALAQLLGQGREQDQSWRGMNDQTYLGLQGLLSGAAGMEMGGNMAYENNIAGRYANYMGVPAAVPNWIPIAGAGAEYFGRSG